MRKAIEDNHRAALPATDVEPAVSHEPLGAEKGQGLDTRVNIHVISYRNRKHDPDGISAKAALDGIVRRGLLTNDSWDEIRRVTFESVITKDQEKTVIIIEQNN